MYFLQQNRISHLHNQVFSEAINIRGNIYCLKKKKNMTAFESITLQQYRRFPLTITTSSKSQHQTKPRSGTYARLSSNDTPKAHQKFHIWNSSEANQLVASLQTRNQSPLTSSEGDQQPHPPTPLPDTHWWAIFITDPAYVSSIFVHGPLPLIPFISWLLFEKSANFGRDCKYSDQTFPLHFSVHSSFSATHIFPHSLTMHAL